MEILYQAKSERIYATFEDAEERRAKKEEYINNGWEVEREHLNLEMEKVIVVFSREIGYEITFS